MTSEKACVKAN